MTSPITTHILDTTRGRPAAGVPIALERQDGDAWRPVGHGVTDADGRLKTLIGDGHPLERGTYRLRFDTAAYWRQLLVDGFYPEVSVVFTVVDPRQHHHVPLLLNPFGYSTYRGS